MLADYQAHPIRTQLFIKNGPAVLEEFGNKNRPDFIY